MNTNAQLYDALKRHELNANEVLYRRLRKSLWVKVWEWLL